MGAGEWFVRKQRRKLKDQRLLLSHVTWMSRMRPKKYPLLWQLPSFSCRPSEFRFYLGMSLSSSLDNCPQAQIWQHSLSTALMGACRIPGSVFGPSHWTATSRRVGAVLFITIIVPQHLAQCPARNECSINTG